MKKILLLTTVTALLSSCGIYTKYQPETTAPDNLYGEGTAVVDTANLGNVDWRELFTDPRLQELIEQGLQSNTDYLSAQLRVEEAKATLLSAKLAFLPSFSLAPQGTVSSFDKQKAVPVGNWIFSVVCVMPSVRQRLCMLRVRTINKRFVLN